MRKYWPFMLLATGVVLLAAGFVYAVMFAGIPYQDPTPELSARYDFNSKMASGICWTGVGLFFAGCFGIFFRKPSA